MLRERRRVQLDLAAGHFYPRSIKIDGRWVRKKCITAAGFNYLNTFAGVGFVDPPRVLDDSGVEVQNPIIHRRRGRPEYVRVVKGAVGRSTNGNLKLTLLTLTYDVEAYFSAELFREWSEDKDREKWGHVSHEAVAKAFIEKHQDFSEIYIGSSNCLVYKLTSPAVLGRLGEQNQKSLYADRLAQSIVERNLLKRHFGFTYANDDGTVEITCWPQVDQDWDSISRAVHTSSGFIDLNGERVQVEAESADVTSEDVDEAGGDAMDLDVSDNVVCKEEQAKPNGSLSELRKLWRRCESIESGSAIRTVAQCMTYHDISLGDIENLSDGHAFLADASATLKAFIQERN